MKSFTLFMHNIYAMGGTVKSVTQLANTLAQKGHPVTIISVFRGAETPYFQLHKDIKIKVLVDYRLKPKNLKTIVANRVKAYTPFLKTKHISQHEPGLNQFSSYVEKKIIKAIKNVSTDVLVGTRASFNILISKYAKTEVSTIGMEHMNFEAHPEQYQREIIAAYRNLNKVTTLTEADRKRYQSQIKTPVYVVPNMITEKKIAAPKKNIIVAAGRLEYEKGFDLLLESVRLIQDYLRSLNYEVHIYGDGKEKLQLQEFINQYDLGDIIQLNESTQDLNSKLAQSKIVVVPSRNEGFGMVILEAMAQDNIVISFKGNVGPDAIIKNGKNGYLVEYENVSQLAKQIDLTTHNYHELEHIVQGGRETLELYQPAKVYEDFMSMFK
ncbi:glycosyltransferase family 4 protein [Staphylococcus caprae]|uniref:glycosyltransferase family 4 protein n=1 Tax=Staphylococcus caprae TaxID=29380 RepID=UPI00254B0688|nr:glycosyltransferase family 4 protein [Staphylococcus caprae]MDK6297963.1 glycosyltransferase family 4 protein [Staphylococcus caprae]MDK7231420.1 glycosyltransferase family 4 protein [Staphylococcus caprae]